MFIDESHWLIVYADDGAKSNWAFEGMQGNDTDPVLTTRVTNNFNTFLYDKLSLPNSGVGDSINQAFHHIMPTMMDSYFEIETPMIFFLVAWEGFLTVMFVVTLVQHFRSKGLKIATKINGQPIFKHCPTCGNEYAEGTLYKCPKCGTQLSSEEYASFHNHDLYE